MQSRLHLLDPTMFGVYAIKATILELGYRLREAVVFFFKRLFVVD